MGGKEKVITLVRKLLAQAEGEERLGNAEAAATFAAKANELTLRHKIEMTDLERHAQDVEDPIVDDYFDVFKDGKVDTYTKGIGHVGGKRRAAWLERLGGALCKAHFCKMLVIPDTKRIRIIGRKSDRELVTFLYAVLTRNALDLAGAHYHHARKVARRQGLPMPHNPFGNFLMGYAQGVGDKLEAMKAGVAKAAGSFAVARFQEAEAAVQKYMAENVATSRIRSPGAPDGNRHAWEAGRQAGKSASLHGGLGAGSTMSKAQGLLGGGK